MIMLLLYNDELNIFRFTIDKSQRTLTEFQLAALHEKYQAQGGNIDLIGWANMAKNNPNVDVMYLPVQKTA